MQYRYNNFFTLLRRLVMTKHTEHATNGRLECQHNKFINNFLMLYNNSMSR